ncbi:chaperonin 10-like protein, partial [Tribonema minus]
QIRAPLKPIGDTIIVKLAEPKEKTDGGLFLPTMDKVQPTTGTVVAAGPGKRHWETGQLYPMGVQPGQKVLFGRFDGSTVKYNGADHLLLRGDDCLLTYEGDAPSAATAQMVGDRILVRIVRELERTKASGVVVAAVAAREQKETMGEVVKMGPGRIAPNGKPLPLQCAVGDQIKFRDFAAEWVAMETLKVDGEDFVVIKNTDVIAKW